MNLNFFIELYGNIRVLKGDNSMAKSQIIKDIANGKVSLKISLSRALVIANDLDNEKMVSWITKELYGYDEDEDVPNYRLISGPIKLTYISGNAQITGQTVSSSIIPEKFDNWKVYNCREGMSVIEDFLVNDTYPILSMVNLLPYVKKTSPFMQFQDMWMELPSSCFKRIIDSISRQLMELLLHLDKELGNLDDLDVLTSEEEKKIINNFINIKIDSFTSIGNDNEIKNSNIAGNEVLNNGKK